VRQTLDDAGGVLATTSYDPWGTPQGTLSAPFGFTGELHSAGQVYLRARWYAPGQGRFVSEDPFAGWTERPDSLHPYIYAGNNPIIWVDPYGKTWYLTFGEAERLANSLKDQSDAFSTQSLGWSEIAVGSPLLADMLVGDHIGGSWPVGRTRIPKLSGVLTVGTTFNAFCAAHQSSTFGAMAELIRDANRRSDFHGDNSPGIALAYVPGQGTGPGGGRLYALNRETGKLLVHSTNFIETHKIPRDMYLGQVVSSQRPVRGYSFRGDILPISYEPILLGPQYTLADPLMVQHGLVMPPISTYPPGHPEIFDPGQTAQYEERVPSQTIR